MQDWEYQVSDPERIDDYLALYDDASLSDDERFSLMMLILDALNLGEANAASKMRMNRTKLLLTRHFNIHAPTIEYWARTDAMNGDEEFRITPWIRTFMPKVEK